MSNNEINLIIEDINMYYQLSDIDIKKIVDVEIGYAYKIAFISHSKYKTGPLRSVFDYVKRIERSDKPWKEKRVEFYLLKPRLAMGVSKNRISKDVYDVIIAAMNLVDVNEGDSKNLENFKYFIYFLESIIAYHKFLGGS